MGKRRGVGIEKSDGRRREAALSGQRATGEEEKVLLQDMMAGEGYWSVLAR